MATTNLAFVSSPSLTNNKAKLAPSASSVARATSRISTSVKCTHMQRQPFVARPLRYQPSVWNYDFIQSLTRDHMVMESQYGTRVEELRREVRQIFQSTTQPLAQLELIDALERLGIAYHFETDIRRVLESVMRATTGFEDLYSTSLRFRLLRNYGFNVSQDVFGRFRDRSGRFLPSIVEDVRGLLHLYEAAHFGFDGESILEEAIAFTSEHLRARVGSVDQILARQIQLALQQPFHRRMRRIAARDYISVYEQIFREDRRFQTVLELARQDYHSVLGMHQRELRELSMWWRELGLADHVSFARDRLAESYFMSVGKFFEPQFSPLRRSMTQINYFMTAIEDMFGRHETIADLERLTQVVESWDISAMTQLPQFMQLFFMGLHTTTNQIAYSIMRQRGRDVTRFLRRAWANLFRSYLVEARWFRSRQTPRLEEYLSNISPAFSAPLLLPSYFFLTERIEDNVVEQLLSGSNLVNLTSQMIRLNADLQTSAVGFGRVNLPRSVQIYMAEARVQEAAARQHIRNMLMANWRRLNRELVGQTFPRPLVGAALNIARMSNALADYTDGVGVLDIESFDPIFTVLAEPFSMA